MTGLAPTPPTPAEPDFDEMAAAVSLAVSWLLLSSKPASKVSDAKLLRAAWRARRDTRDAPGGALDGIQALTRHYDSGV